MDDLKISDRTDGVSVSLEELLDRRSPSSNYADRRPLMIEFIASAARDGVVDD